MTTDGPVVLLELAHQLHEDWPRVARALRNLADAWEAERAQAAADRAALATAQHANDAERGEWSEYYALLTGDRGAWSPDDMRRAVKAQTDALAQARALLAEAEARRMTRYETNDDTDFWYRVLGWLGGAAGR